MTTINVTAEHIARGEPRDCLSCPVALALEDAFPGAACLASRDSVSVSGGGRYLRVPHPDSVLKFIRAFDSDEPVEPFTFDLDYPAEVAA